MKYYKVTFVINKESWGQSILIVRQVNPVLALAEALDILDKKGIPAMVRDIDVIE